MVNKQLHAKLDSVGDLARQYRELCELRAELERRTYRLEQSRPRRGRPTATDRPSAAEPKASDIRWVDAPDHLEKGRVARLNRETEPVYLRLMENHGRRSFCGNNQVQARRLIAGGSAFVCNKSACVRPSRSSVPKILDGLQS